MKYVFDHDYHIHSQLSLCSQDPEQNAERMLRYAKENGLKSICVTDHFWDEAVPGASAWYQQQNYAWISSIKPLPQDVEVEFLFGCECELRHDMCLGLAVENFDRFDFVVIPFTHLHMGEFTLAKEDDSPEGRARVWVKRLEALLNMPLPFHKVGIAHMTCALMANPVSWEGLKNVLQLISDEDMYRIFTKAAKCGVGIELNTLSCPEEEEEIMFRPYRIAKQCGCRFYCGSDAHHPEELEKSRLRFESYINKLGLEESDKFIIGK